MSGNSIGSLLTLTTAGESHGEAYVGILDGLPSGLKIQKEYFKEQMKRRAPSQTLWSTKRKEPDDVEFLAGLDPDFITMGSPIAFMIRNRDKKSQDYDFLQEFIRPGHSDFTYLQKYKKLQPGSGRASARETVCRMVAGSICEQILQNYNITINASVTGIGEEQVILKNTLLPQKEIVWSNPMHTLFPQMEEKWRSLLEQAVNDGDSLGSLVQLEIHGLPIGVGRPVFHKLKSTLAQALFSLPAVMSVEYGKGKESAKDVGSLHQDLYDPEKQCFLSNNHGGILGGLSSGAPITMTVGLKPPSSIGKTHLAFNYKNKTVEELSVKGRHDPVLAIRFLPVAVAQLAYTILDEMLYDQLIDLSPKT
jgi:chorismate synthase